MTRDGAGRRTVRPRPAPSGRRRPAVLLALLWLIAAVVSHHSLPGTALPMASSMPHPSAMRPAATQPAAAARHDGTPPRHAGSPHAHPADSRLGRAEPGHRPPGQPLVRQAQSDHADHGGAHCSSYDVRSEQFVSPPPLIGHARAPEHAAAVPPEPHRAGGPSPPDPAALSVLRI
ncbi:hypothetical protein [Streptomyces sp. NPDC093097]|uniref:hypothetical protein n=1 Tax=Streptomyces sp. NPDC093097 TaxID=3366027 RepID=UPI003817C12C